MIYDHLKFNFQVGVAGSIFVPSEVSFPKSSLFCIKYVHNDNSNQFNYSPIFFKIMLLSLYLIKIAMNQNCENCLYKSNLKISRSSICFCYCGHAQRHRINYQLKGKWQTAIKKSNLIKSLSKALHLDFKSTIIIILFLNSDRYVFFIFE